MKTFTTWTVLEHKPIEKLADNLWRVSGLMGSVQRQMVLARMRDGRVVVHNAIALAEPAMAELEAWGEPAVLIVPNGYHRQDAAIWKQRYPRMQVVAPPAGRARIEKVVRVDALATEAAQDATVAPFLVDGNPADVQLRVTSDDGTTLVFCDAILNLKRKRGPLGVFLGPTGRVSVPRVQRWLAIRDKRAFAQHVARLAETPALRRLLFGHGSAVREDCATPLRGVVTQLS